MNTFERVRGIVAKTMDTDEKQVTPETSPTGDLGADSLEIMEMTMAFEEEFCMTFQDEELPSLQTIHQIVDYIEAQKGETRSVR